MERWIFHVAAGVLAIVLAACGGRQSVASRSAEAYDESMKKGTPVGGGHGHAGHGATAPDTAAAGDHAQHGGAMEATDHAAHSPAPAGDHARHAATDPHAGHAMPSPSRDHAQHGTASRDDHAAHAMPSAQPGHAQHGAASRDAHAGHAMPSQPGAQAQHGAAAGGHEHGSSSAAIPPGGLWGPVPGAAPASPRVAPPLPVAPAPLTNDAMAGVSPGAALKADRADTPSSISVREAQKASGKERP